MTTIASLYLPEAEAKVKDHLLELSDPSEVTKLLADAFGLDITYDHDQLIIELDGEEYPENDLYTLIEETVDGATTDQIAKAYGEINEAYATVVKLPVGVSVIELREKH